ncbi:hypothetical protein WOLCODRAFT_158658 [Wolfiporia cocos MD-104 SS10]|uniref:Uncharacterized protein n=1 Tax=Wolfiporia cocos (strain MD-104) TaxID=742152 RepID=A0A2H3JN11_WOLCO|nr:hypothetical protein WOLCODRAFT_158658 [Wolfiporia cocos MD-104 SS10]
MPDSIFLTKPHHMRKEDCIAILQHWEDAKSGRNGAVPFQFKKYTTACRNNPKHELHKAIYKDLPGSVPLEKKHRMKEYVEIDEARPGSSMAAGGPSGSGAQVASKNANDENEDEQTDVAEVTVAEVAEVVEVTEIVEVVGVVGEVVVARASSMMMSMLQLTVNPTWP